MRTEHPRILGTGLATLGGAVAGGTAGGTIGALITYGVQGPNPPGLEGLAVVVAGFAGATLLSYPGAILGAWLVVRGRARARPTLAILALLYPAALGMVFLLVAGLHGRWVVPLQLLAPGAVVGAGAAARALATGRDEAAASARASGGE